MTEKIAGKIAERELSKCGSTIGWGVTPEDELVVVMISAEPERLRRGVFSQEEENELICYLKEGKRNAEMGGIPEEFIIRRGDWFIRIWVTKSQNEDIFVGCEVGEYWGTYPSRLCPYDHFMNWLEGRRNV